MIQYVRKHSGTLLMILMEAVVGVLLLCKPVGFTQGLIIAAGVLMALSGVKQMIGYFLAKAEQASKNAGLFRGLTALSLGLFAAVNSVAILAAFPMVTALYGGVVFISGLYKVQLAVDAARMKQGYVSAQVISALFTLAFAVVTIANPFASTAALWVFIGAMLLADAVIDVTAMILTARKQNGQNAAE